MLKSKRAAGVGFERPACKFQACRSFVQIIDAKALTAAVADSPALIRAIMNSVGVISQLDFVVHCIFFPGLPARLGVSSFFGKTIFSATMF